MVISYGGDNNDMEYILLVILDIMAHMSPS